MIANVQSNFVLENPVYRVVLAQLNAVVRWIIRVQRTKAIVMISTMGQLPPTISTNPKCRHRATRNKHLQLRPVVCRPTMSRIHTQHFNLNNRMRWTRPSNQLPNRARTNREHHVRRTHRLVFTIMFHWICISTTNNNSSISSNNNISSRPRLSLHRRHLNQTLMPNWYPIVLSNRSFNASMTTSSNSSSSNNVHLHTHTRLNTFIRLLRWNPPRRIRRNPWINYFLNRWTPRRSIFSHHKSEHRQAHRVMTHLLSKHNNKAMTSKITRTIPITIIITIIILITIIACGCRRQPIVSFRHFIPFPNWKVTCKPLVLTWNWCRHRTQRLSRLNHQREVSIPFNNACPPPNSINIKYDPTRWMYHKRRNSHKLWCCRTTMATAIHAMMRRSAIDPVSVRRVERQRCSWVSEGDTCVCFSLFQARLVYLRIFSPKSFLNTRRVLRRFVILITPLALSLQLHNSVVPHRNFRLSPTSLISCLSRTIIPTRPRNNPSSNKSLAIRFSLLLHHHHPSRPHRLPRRPAPSTTTSPLLIKWQPWLSVIWFTMMFTYMIEKWKNTWTWQRQWQRVERPRHEKRPIPRQSTMRQANQWF